MKWVAGKKYSYSRLQYVLYRIFIEIDYQNQYSLLKNNYKHYQDLTEIDTYTICHD